MRLPPLRDIRAGIELAGAALGVIVRAVRWLTAEEPHQVPLSRADEKRISKAMRCAGHEHEPQCRPGGKQ